MQIPLTNIDYINVGQYVLIRELGLTRRHIGHYIDLIGMATVKNAYKRRSHQLFRAHSFPRPWATPPNKIFSSLWLDNDTLLLGCKDNTLWELSIRCTPWKIRSIDIGQELGERRYRVGMRAMRRSPSSLFVACTYKDSRSISVLSSDGLEQVLLLPNQVYSINDCEWVSDTHIVTAGSKGETAAIRCFSSDPDHQPPSIVYKSFNHDPKDYRSVKMMPQRSKYLLASESGVVQLFDASRFSPVQAFFKADHPTFRALDYSNAANAFVIASEGSIYAYDPRNNSIFNEIPFTCGSSLRTVSIDEFRITFCSGSGHIAFGDIRSNKVLEIDNNAGFPSLDRILEPDPNTPILQAFRYSYHLSGGHILPNDFYREVFLNGPVENGIFTHCYDSSGLRLFVGGGPTLAAIDGCNLALLS